MGKASTCKDALLSLVLLLGVIDVLAGQAPYACDQSNATLAAFPFCNTSLPITDRVEDYVARLTLEEKISQLINTATGIPRLGVPKYQWWQEALHGVASSPGVQFGGSVPAATSFPMPITTAASFNTSLFYGIGQAVSTEARAMHNLGQSGLTFWSPNINIYRDPRWGRGQETPGEDPLLSSNFATYYVRGLQESQAGSDKLKVSACCKHMTAYDVDNWLGTDRYHFNAIVTEQDLEDTYNAPFKSCVEDGGVSSVMCSYNRLNGVPTCADHELLTTTVRETWKLNGYIVSDCDSLQVFFDNTNYAATAEDAAADALLAGKNFPLPKLFHELNSFPGLNLNCGTFLAKHTLSAIQQKKVTEATINQALTYLVTVQMRLGLYDGDPKSQTYGSLGASDVCTSEHQTLALEAARQGMVLLKNLGALPLSTSKIKSLAVVGPHANATRAMIGNYAGIPCKYTSPLQAFQKYAQVSYAPGCANVACSSDSLISGAVSAAAAADAVVVAVGLDLTIEAESLDRTSLLLPGKQQELVSQVMQAAKGPVVIVILSAGAIDIPFALSDSRIAGILWAGYPGQAGGAAIAEVIFGDHNPSGKLPATWYPQNFTSISMLDMNMRPNASTGYPGRTYRFYTGPTIFKFGDGLSYTSLSAKFIKAPSFLSIPSTAPMQPCTGLKKSSSCFHLDATDEKSCESLKSQVAISVRNKGAMAISHTLMLFSTPPSAGSDGVPQRQLVGFNKIQIAGDSISNPVIFDLDPCRHFVHADRDGKKLLRSGTHVLTAGNEQHSLRLLVRP
ncbi:beta-xylosidase/alpha-L-arabinofuranosidase 2 isoform X1 [Selaginella moellendorffii]|uniref:beta-xylosidase/alpha-L-arabinofuranosidase 2 isoform X1 n=1 Tax=Selaginella moellendorffii TaxID=88036 RepID=UPI000D1CCE01|nr:beta-xylosidase/alpha-L-arabinofuranosidase 2 isoform X1 [Selaginella moellendorffii]|eukprot:XP_024517089.1 beta-xylosidase/alpha-L-arabinofuranosidase 2 isoform X1 [Selaginella moellendorffii]